MILDILVYALVLGGASSCASFHLNDLQICGSHEDIQPCEYSIISASTGADEVEVKAKVKQLPSLYEADIDTLAKGLECNQFTSVDLVQAYTARIKEVNDKLRPVTETNPDALSIASALDEERVRGVLRGPLHGIPILIKDTIATNDAMNTTAGSYALLGAKVPHDSTIALKLRNAGAIILGKTNPSEWSSFRIFDSANGWSAYGGQTLGPFFPRQDPSGSSSGSAVGASLGLATVTLGGETSGSIIDPASYNNVVGVKPTVGLTSRNLVIPISERMDTIGPMTKTVRDAAYVLSSIAGFDPRDNYTSAIPDDADMDFLGACRREALRGARLGVPRNVIRLMAQSDKSNSTWSMVQVFDEALSTLRSLGAHIIEKIDTDFPAAQSFLNEPSLSAQIMGADFIINLETYLSQLTTNPNNITSLSILRTWIQESPLECYPNKSTEVWDAALANWNNTTPEFWDAYMRGVYYGDEGGLLGTIRRNHLDAVILPSHIAWDWAGIVGAPVVGVPLGAMPPGQNVIKNQEGIVQAAPGIPFGLSFLGAKFSDAKLIGLAYAFEQHTMVRDTVRPYIMPRTDLAGMVGRKGENNERDGSRAR
ncbi:amidase signature domain-containing protein [Aspergillus undulatus]|uniref:amidase signature domain-containing protein n=1 Tax=Aspergillus undulatus TaxID=1810928 RepID=UPI003CCD2A34